MTPLTYRQEKNGRWSARGLDASIGAVETFSDDQPVRDWLHELALPKDHELLAAMAVSSGGSGRFLRAVVCDESMTKLGFRFQPALMTCRPQGTLLTLAHLGYAIGESKWMTFEQSGVIEGTEGIAIVALCELFDSALSDRVWEGIQRQIFGHTCAIVIRPEGEPPGVGHIQEIALIDRPANMNAKIIQAWELPLMETTR